ncbi:hypothetical protein [Maribacter aestuarii]|uniref:hypothetical protein n=1 Tax=Maribacter aestuarii TaxID=1130723 RepID=UPI0025A5687B|nr:hypothetical protein [Maribacter aestuarii]
MKSICLLVITSLFTFIVNAQEITMFSSFTGYKYYQDDKEISKDDLQSLLYKNDEVKKFWKKSKTQEAISIVGIASEMSFAVWMTLELLNDDPFLSGRDRAQNALGPALGVIGTGIVGGIFMYASNNSKKKAILTYNKQFDNKTSFRLVPACNENGLGLALQF